MPANPALERWRQDDQEFKGKLIYRMSLTSLGYMRPFLKQNTIKISNKNKRLKPESIPNMSRHGKPPHLSQNAARGAAL